MNSCVKLHQLVHMLQRHSFSFDPADLPQDGIYLLFEEEEYGHGGSRIVRVGTHTGDKQLRSRLRQHFITPNKDRSIFRKNIGRALLTRNKNPFLAHWELDLTSATARKEHAGRIDSAAYVRTEKAVSAYVQSCFSFSVLPVPDMSERLKLESRIISTVSSCSECKPSANWLGHLSPKQKIRDSGLWLVNELYKQPLDDSDLARLTGLIEAEQR